jgi:hypothetical protein
MPVNPHVKGGADVPVPDGGTGASDAASGLSNLGGLDAAIHAVLNHAGIPGVGDLTTASHSSLNHAGVPGVPAPLTAAMKTAAAQASTITLATGFTPKAAILILGYGDQDSKGVAVGATSGTQACINTGAGSIHTSGKIGSVAAGPNFTCTQFDATQVVLTYAGGGSTPYWLLVFG